MAGRQGGKEDPASLQPSRIMPLLAAAHCSSMHVRVRHPRRISLLRSLGVLILAESPTTLPEAGLEGEKDLLDFAGGDVDVDVDGGGTALSISTWSCTLARI